jgi:hypothetical protein
MKRTSRTWYVWVLLSLIIVVASAAATYLIDEWFFSVDLPPVQRVFSPQQTPPPLRLAAIDGSGELDLAVRKSARPTVLVFASFTCTRFHQRMRHLEKIYQSYKDRADFAFVVGPEAGHEIAGYEFLLEDVEDILTPGLTSPMFARNKRAPDGTTQTRAERVRRAMRKANFTWPAFLDRSGHEAASLAYYAYPARLMVISGSGTIVKDFGNILHKGWDMAELTQLLDYCR